MDSVQGTRALPRVGFPIRKSPDQSSLSSSPGLIAAFRVLHRLLVPRHPPCALVLLYIDEITTCHYAVFKVRGGHPPESPPATLETRTTTGRRSACLSKLNSMRPTSSQARRPARRGRRSSRRVPDRARNAICGRQVTHRGELHIYQGDANDAMRRIPRKEVIQPQLPLRLPCYDFTPVTDSTFDCSLPCGLGHRLRVFPAPVV